MIHFQECPFRQGRENESRENLFLKWHLLEMQSLSFSHAILGEEAQPVPIKNMLLRRPTVVSGRSLRSNTKEVNLQYPVPVSSLDRCIQIQTC